MENYFYTCPECGFVHLIPAYWVDFNPPEEYEMEHISMKTGDKCSCDKLLYNKANA